MGLRGGAHWQSHCPVDSDAAHSYIPQRIGFLGKRHIDVCIYCHATRPNDRFGKAKVTGGGDCDCPLCRSARQGSPHGFICKDTVQQTVFAYRAFCHCGWTSGLLRPTRVLCEDDWDLHVQQASMTDAQIKKAEADALVNNVHWQNRFDEIRKQWTSSKKE